MKNFSGALMWLTLSEIVYNLSGYIIHAFTGRILGPEAYGRYGIVITLTTMVIVLVGNGVPTTMSKYLSAAFEKNPGDIYAIRKSAMKLQVIIMGSLTLLFFLAAPLIASFLGDPTLTPLFRLSSLIIPAFAASSFNLYYFIGLHFFRVQALLKTIRSLARVGFIVTFAYYFGVTGAVTGNILAPFTVFITGLLIEAWLTRTYFPKALSEKSEVLFPWQTLLHYAWPLTVFLLFYELILTADLYLVKAILGSDYLTGIYNAAITVGRIPYYLFYALAIILIPAIAKTTSENDHAETERIVNKSLRLMTLLLFPLVTLLIAYAPQALSLFYGTPYAPAASIMHISVLGVGFLTVFYILSFALNGAGLVKIPMKLSIYGVILTVILNLLLIPRYELMGAAFSTTITCFILMLAILWYTEHHFRVRLSLRTISASLASAMLIALAARVLPNGNWSFLFSGTLLFFTYFTFLRLFRELKHEDIAPLLKAFQRAK
ncbi:MAG: flippase [Candidatus Moraniibacteriota bacterium]|nr:MAG: flippase [Candidatus Moranbacteria bacterium]